MRPAARRCAICFIARTVRGCEGSCGTAALGCEGVFRSQGFPDHRLNRSRVPLPLPRSSQIGAAFRGGHPRPSQIGVDFSDQTSIGVGLTDTRFRSVSSVFISGEVFDTIQSAKPALQPAAYVSQPETPPPLTLLLITKAQPNSTERSPNGQSLFFAFFSGPLGPNFRLLFPFLLFGRQRVAKGGSAIRFS